jgi:hypothetical protein
MDIFYNHVFAFVLIQSNKCLSVTLSTDNPSDKPTDRHLQLSSPDRESSVPGFCSLCKQNYCNHDLQSQDKLNPNIPLAFCIQIKKHIIITSWLSSLIITDVRYLRTLVSWLSISSLACFREWFSVIRAWFSPATRLNGDLLVMSSDRDSAARSSWISFS